MKQRPPDRRVLVRDGLSDTQRPVFDDLVADFSHAINMRDGIGHLPYDALAEMVRMGWRLAEEPDDSRDSMRRFQVAMQTLGPAGPPDGQEFFYSMDRWGTVASAYMEAGNVLCQLIESDPEKTLIFPMLFCYRHFIEVSIKELILLAGANLQDTLKKLKNPHSLVQLHQALDGCFSEEAQSTTIGQETSLRKELDLLHKWAECFDKVDAKSDRFRYAEDRRSRPYDFPDIQALFPLTGLSTLRAEMKRLDEAIHNIAIVAIGPPEPEGNEAN